MEQICISCKKEYEEFKITRQGKKTTNSMFCKTCIELHEEQSRDGDREANFQIE